MKQHYHKNERRGDLNMWVITIFEKDTFHIFEYSEKSEATAALQKMKETAILSYTK